MLHPRLSDIEGHLVLITPRAYELRQVPWDGRTHASRDWREVMNPNGRSHELREVMRCDLVVLDPPVHGPRHMAVSVGRVPDERTEVVLPARFLDVWIAAAGVVAYCRQLDGETAGRINRYQRMGGPKAWGVRPLTPSDQAILTRYRREAS